MNRGGESKTRNSFWMLVGQIASKGAFFLSLMLYSRYLDGDEFGRLTFAAAMGVFILFLGDMGVSLVVTKRVAAGQSAPGSALGGALSLRASLSVLSFAAMAGVGFLMGYSVEQRALMVLVGLGFVIEGFCESFYAVFRARERMMPEGLARIAEGLACLASTLIVIRSDLGVAWAGCAYIARSGMALAVSLAFALSTGSLPVPRPSRSLLSGLLRESLPLGVMGLLLILAQRFDNLILKTFEGDAAVGAYQRCFRIYESLVLLVAPTLLPGALFPDLCRSVTDGSGRTRRSLASMVELFLSLAVAVCSPLLVSGLRIPRLVWGDGFLGGVGQTEVLGTFRLLIAAVPLTYLFHTYLTAVIALNRQREVLPIFLGTFALQSMGNMIFIPRFGLEAAALMQILSLLVSTLLLWWRTRRALAGTGLLSGLARPLVSIVPAIAVGLIAQLPVLLRAMLSTVVYAAAWLALGGAGTVGNLLGSARQSQ